MSSSTTTSEMHEESISPRQNDLHARFMELVHEMKSAGVEFPPDFKPYYAVVQYTDRSGSGITFTPYLNPDNAIVPKNKKWKGKYGCEVRAKRMECGEKVNLDDSRKGPEKPFGSSWQIEGHTDEEQNEIEESIGEIYGRDMD